MDRAVRRGGQNRDARHGGRAPEERERAVLSLASEVLRSSGGLRFAALGASMVPTIFPGDVLIVRRETARKPRCGDVVLCIRAGRFCAHRVVEKREEGGRLLLVTRGDALRENDLPLAEMELLGRVTAVVRRQKRIALDGPLTARELLLRWAARRSNGAVKWMLRWHRVRSWLARNPEGAVAETQPEPLECA